MGTTILGIDDGKLARIVRGKAVNAHEATHIDHDRPIGLALIAFNMPGRDGFVPGAALRLRARS